MLELCSANVFDVGFVASRRSPSRSISVDFSRVTRLEVAIKADPCVRLEAAANSHRNMYVSRVIPAATKALYMWVHHTNGLTETYWRKPALANMDHRYARNEPVGNRSEVVVAISV